MSGEATAWLVFVAALLLTLGLLALACTQIAHNLDEAQHDLELDALWNDDDLCESA